MGQKLFEIIIPHHINMHYATRTSVPGTLSPTVIVHAHLYLLPMLVLTCVFVYALHWRSSPIVFHYAVQPCMGMAMLN